VGSEYNAKGQSSEVSVVISCHGRHGTTQQECSQPRQNPATPRRGTFQHRSPPGNGCVLCCHSFCQPHRRPRVKSSYKTPEKSHAGEFISLNEKKERISSILRRSFSLKERKLPSSVIFKLTFKFFL